MWIERMGRPSNRDAASVRHRFGRAAAAAHATTALHFFGLRNADVGCGLDSQSVGRRFDPYTAYQGLQGLSARALSPLSLMRASVRYQRRNADLAVRRFATWDQIAEAVRESAR